MPSLNWLGKERVINHHLDVPFHTLKPASSYGDAEAAKSNLIIHGDNLLALKALLPEYEGKVKLIYIDPPYNTGNENWVYNDNVNDPKIKKWLGQVVGKEGEDLFRHDKWLCMMYPRLKLLQKLLRDDGAIFISIDDNEQANLKLICDEIFGAGNFVGLIAWESKTKCQNTQTARRQLQRKYEHIIVYKKQLGRYEFILKESEVRQYPEIDKKGRFRIEQVGEMSATGMRGRSTMVFPIQGIYPKNGNQWKYGIDTINEFQDRGDLFVKNDKAYFRIRETDEENKFEPFWSLFFKEIGTAETAKKELTSILKDHEFETVKPSNLIVELIPYVCDKSENAIILDSFAGSGTTAHAVLKLNKEDGGNRRFILIETEDYADTITAERVRRVIDGYGSGDKKVEGTGGGFTYCNLGATIFTADGELNPSVSEAAFRQYIWYAETKSALPKTTVKHKYFLGSFFGVSYYFYFKNNRKQF